MFISNVWNKKWKSIVFFGFVVLNCEHDEKQALRNKKPTWFAYQSINNKNDVLARELELDATSKMYYMFIYNTVLPRLTGKVSVGVVLRGATHNTHSTHMEVAPRNEFLFG